MSTVNQLQKEKPMYFLIVISDNDCHVRYTHQLANIPDDLGDYCRFVKNPIDIARSGLKHYKRVSTAISDIQKINPDANIRRVYFDEWDKYLNLETN